MALLRYFERKDSKKQSLLPHPNGPLAKFLTPAMKAAKLQVGAIMESPESSDTTCHAFRGHLPLMKFMMQ